MERKIRILLAKPGLDGHDRGIKVIAAAMRDAGYEVIYSGLRQTPEMIVRAAIDEDVDAIGLSILSGAHMTLFPKVAALLKEESSEHILLTGGGIISGADMTGLHELGVGKLFGPGTTLAAIVDYVREEVTRRRSTLGRDQEDVAK
jgi:methylmalonyl-CoA mutase C-terminal domain/subunit